jgi:transposase
MNKSTRYSPEVRERAVRMVFEHQGEHESHWAAIESISAKIGCTAETLRKWVRQAECDRGLRAGVSSDEWERLKALERENRELRRANEILRKASAYFAQAELERRSRYACWQRCNETPARARIGLGQCGRLPPLRNDGTSARATSNVSFPTAI